MVPRPLKREIPRRGAQTTYGVGGCEDRGYSQSVAHHSRGEYTEREEVASIPRVASKDARDGLIPVLCARTSMQYGERCCGMERCRDDDAPFRATIFQAVGLKAMDATEMSRDCFDRSMIELAMFSVVRVVGVVVNVVELAEARERTWWRQRISRASKRAPRHNYGAGDWLAISPPSCPRLANSLILLRCASPGSTSRCCTS